MRKSVFLPVEEKVMEEEKFQKNKSYKVLLNNLSTGEKIKIYRRFLGLSQKELAKSIGVSEPTLSKYENDRNQGINETVLKRAAKVFEIPTVYLLDGTWWE